ncbi:speckle-type POZ protein B-like [Nasonia vitripennis]|uniref:BTB domain-containing protein n=1 Tax=Nasonia vitripennis TaxID=7425 RepID=A0A7M7H587_NASVI|nr:speckle-type POZ protein B-like [Nasonia vitripennis]
MAAIWGEISALNPTYAFKWVIRDFHVDGYKLGEAIKSSVFAVTSINDKYHWQLLLYPKGNIEYHKEFCSIGFLNRQCSKAFRGSITFSLVDGKDNVVRRIEIVDRIFSPNKLNGNPRFFPRRLIANVLRDGNLTIVCTVRMGATSQAEKDEMKVADERIDVDEKTEEKVDDESALRLREFDDFEHLLDEKAFSDVIFIVGGNTLYAHKCILSTRSAVFAAMFLHEMLERQENKVEVKDVDYDVFREMMRFMYTGKVNRLDSTMAYDLLIAADKYALDTLKNMTEKKLCDGLTDSSALEYLQLADRYGAKKLKERAVEFIIQHADVIIKSEEFKALPNQLVIEICGAMANKIT